MPLETREVEDDAGLDAAMEELLAAARKYREYVKRHNRDRLAGVMFIRCGHEMVVYSESENYANQILGLTFDDKRDSFVATCDHEWIDIRNEVIESGTMCRKCHKAGP